MPDKTPPSAAQLLDDMRAGRVTATSVMEATLERIAQINPTVNAIVSLRAADDLMEEARAADNSDAKGPLHGLPVAVKDLADVAGIATTKGSALLVDNIPKTDEIMVARMRAAGAIFIGKTNTPELGVGSHTFNPVHGITRNPYNTSFSCGGSSGGAAVALATGMTLLADGSDMMGSLRNPAGWNNVYGFRPSWGLVPSEPVDETFLHHISTLGPMARSPEDMALLLDVIAGPDPRQPHNMAHHPVTPVTAAQPKGKRIAWMRDWGGAFPMEAGILDTCDAAVSVLGELGAEIETPTPPFDAEALFQSWATLRAWKVGLGVNALVEQGGSPKDTGLWELEKGRALSAFDVHAASIVRSDWFKAAAHFFETYDAFVLPTAQVWPFSNDIEYPREIAGVQMDTYHRWMAAMVPASLAGLPALAAPAGFGSNGLPIGIQIVGRHGADGMLMQLGAAYHAATQWPDTRPPQL